jgi:hypothetical protein
LAFAASSLSFAMEWEKTPSSVRSRILFLGVIVAGALITWHWEAMIISFLAVRVVNLPFNSLEELMAKTDKKKVRKAKVF